MTQSNYTAEHADVICDRMIEGESREPSGAMSVCRVKAPSAAGPSVMLTASAADLTDVQLKALDNFTQSLVEAKE